jgi:hypothetical protein
MVMTKEEMQHHLYELAATEGCRLDQAPNMAGMMYVEFGYVEGPTIEDTVGHYPNAESRYLVCLHELGHFFHAHTQGRPLTGGNVDYSGKVFNFITPEYWEDNSWYFHNGVLRSEAEAWNYALDKCAIPNDEIKPETRRFMWDACLGSYFSHARSVGFATPGQKLYNGDRAYVEFAYGRPDKYFFGTKRRIVEGDVVQEISPKGATKKIYYPPNTYATIETVNNWTELTNATFTTFNSNTGN